MEGISKEVFYDNPTFGFFLIIHLQDFVWFINLSHLGYNKKTWSTFNSA